MGVVYWTLSIVAILSIFFPMINGQSLDPGYNTVTKMITPVLLIVTPIIMNVAHRKMSQVGGSVFESNTHPVVMIDLARATAPRHQHTHSPRSWPSIPHLARNQRLSSKLANCATPFAATITLCS